MKKKTFSVFGPIRSLKQFVSFKRHTSQCVICNCFSNGNSYKNEFENDLENGEIVDEDDTEVVEYSE